MKRLVKPTPATGTVTIVDVARAAGVSYATVSRVINNDPYVKDETRQRVQEVLTQLRYVANRQARSLRGGRTQTIGLLVRDLGTGYIGEIVRGIDAEASQAHYDLMLYTTHSHQISEIDKESAHVQTLTKGMVDGLLLVLPRNPEHYLADLRQRRFPHVLIDHQGLEEMEKGNEGVSGASVAATNWQGGYDATQYLIQLGHRRIGFISGTLSMRCARDRLAGYQAALKQNALSVDPSLVVTGDFAQPSGFDGAKQLLSNPSPPTAIFASNDVMAFGAMEAVRDQGLHIPEDISIVGFDDIPQAANLHPPLTTVRQPLEEMGRVATQMLIEMIADPDLPNKRQHLPTQLLLRHSCQSVTGWGDD